MSHKNIAGVGLCTLVSADFLFSVISVNVLSSHQCSDVVGWVTGGAFGLRKNLSQLSPKIPFYGPWTNLEQGKIDKDTN